MTCCCRERRQVTDHQFVSRPDEDIGPYAKCWHVTDRMPIKTLVCGRPYNEHVNVLVPGLLAAARLLDGYLTMHPNSTDGKDIYHLLQELHYMADNPEENDQ